MSRKLLIRGMLWLFVVAICCSAEAADKWGDLTGQFIYKGKAPARAKLKIDKDQAVCGKVELLDESLVVSEEGGLANVVLYVRSKKVKVHPDYKATDDAEVVIDNKDCRFEPHIVTIRTTQKLIMKNSDSIGHNTKGDPLGDEPFNPLIPAGGSAEHHFAKVQTLPQPVQCNIHGWMKAHIVIRDNPYMAVTDKDGKFEIKNLPAGELEFLCWQEKSGYLAAKSDWAKGRFTLKIAEGANDLGTIEVDPKLFEKKR